MALSAGPQLCGPDNSAVTYLPRQDEAEIIDFLSALRDRGGQPAGARPRLVGPDIEAGMRTALRDPTPGYAARALEALEPFSPRAVDRLVVERLLPRLLAEGAQLGP